MFQMLHLQKLLRFLMLPYSLLLLLLFQELGHFLLPVSGRGIGLGWCGVDAHLLGTGLRRGAIAEMGLTVGICPLVDGSVRKRTKGKQK